MLKLWQIRSRSKKTNFVQVRNYDTNDLSQIYLSHHKPISNLFLTLSITTFREALKYVHELPYGRNNNRTDYLLVISEKCGTCSTKHALIKHSKNLCSSK